MLPRSVRNAARLLAVGTLAFLAACQSDLGDAKLKAIPLDATRDQVVAAMGSGMLTAMQPTDSVRLANGFRRQMYIVNGKQFEVLWYREQPGSLVDKITRDNETPVVLIDGKFAGYGWSYFGKLTEAENLPNPLNDAARVDSIARSQIPKP